LTADQNTDSCDARQSLLYVPTSDRIELHAEELLSRALSLKPPIAFVGAGTSMAYGRISWRDAVIAMQREVLADSEGNKDPVCTRLRDLLKKVQLSAGVPADSGDYLVTFQIAEQLDDALRASPASRDKMRDKRKFRERLTDLVKDDLGHAQHILNGAIEDFSDAPKVDLRDAGAARMDFRSKEFLQKVLAAVEREPTYTLVPGLHKKLEAFCVASSNDRFLLAYHRFVTGVALRLVSPGQLTDCLNWLRKEPGNNETVADSSHLPLERDPLWLLRDCDISRFLTTNYDKEIDNCLAREGLVPEHEQEERTEPRTQSAPHSKPGRQLARRWRSWVFDHHQVGQLLAFAAGTGRRLVEVVHLHGKAGSVQGLVVTNADYQRHYLSLDERRAGMDDALAAAFGGNAMLFVGSGMGEDDLLRPLRQFVGDHVPGSRRVAIAIVPADKSEKDRATDLDKLRNLQRYGVYTIHTGHATLPPGDGSQGDEAATPPQDTQSQEPAHDKPADKPPERWLTRISHLRRLLEDVLSSSSIPVKPVAKKRYERACEEVKEWLDFAFPGHRQRPLDSPVQLEKVPVGNYKGLSLTAEVDLIDYIARTVRDDADGLWEALSNSDGKKGGRLRGALKAALEGCMDSIVGAFLCARLIRMKRDAGLYVGDLLQLPEAENPSQVVKKTLDEPAADEAAPDPESALWVRHGVYIPVRPWWAEARGEEVIPWARFFRGAPSQSFNRLMDCLRDKQQLPPAPTGRRLFVFIGDRGVGKGHFFHALSYPPHLNELRGALGCPPDKPWPAVFFNCGVSHEFTSVFDFLPELLLQAARQLINSAPDDDQQRRNLILKGLKDRACDLANDRLARLKSIVRDLRLAVPAGARIIVAFSGLSALFDRQGEAKNAQIRRLFDLLFGGDSISSPIDFILVTDGDRLPANFRKGARHPPGPLKELRHQSVQPWRLIELDKRASRLEAARRPETPISLQDEKEAQQNQEHQAYFHFLSHTRACVMATTSFPSVAIVLALDAVFDCPKDPDDLRLIQLPPRFDDWASALLNTQVFEAATAASIRRQIIGLLDPASEPPEREGMATPPPPGPDEVNARLPKLLTHLALRAARQDKGWHTGIAGLWAQLSRTAPAPGDSTLEKLSTAIDFRMRDLFNACAGTRYGFTLLMATALQYLLNGRAENGGPHQGIIQCRDFLIEMRLKLERTVEAGRVEIILQRAFDVLSDLDRRPYRCVPEDFKELKSCGRLFDFQKAILWALGVIGQPVTVEVLARSPAILRFTSEFGEIFSGPHWEKEHQAKTLKKWTELVRSCLGLLEYRCLLFRIRPRDPSVDKAPRYAVHAQMQRHVFRHLHAPFVEYPEADQFALTLFANQPNDVPRLTAEADHDLYSTVAALINYPDENMLSERQVLRTWPVLPGNADPRAVDSKSPDSRGTDSRDASSNDADSRDADSTDADSTEADSKDPRKVLELQAQLLRSALGIVRSVYSLSTIVKFAPERSSGLDGAPPRQVRQPPIDGPLLERHRFLIHWMIRQAALHDKEVKACNVDTESTPVRKAFYSEELAWLYNEAGVLSYTQGRMLEAKVFFSLAKVAAKQIEPDEDGAIHVRIALNAAMADIDRGRMSLAEPALLRIHALEDEDPPVQLLAAGLLGLIEHVRGRFASAHRYYDEALLGHEVTPGNRRPGLVSLRCTRAAAIIGGLQGDLRRAQGDYPGADTVLRQSATAAIEAGHEDVRHWTRLRSLRLEMARAAKQITTNDGIRIHNELDIIEDYAVHMGMPRLQCEVDLIRAGLRQLDGDLQAAASVASRGLTIASANDLVLRKTSFLLRLAEIFHQRSQLHECRAVLSEAFDIAREAEYHSAREDGQRLFAKIGGRQPA
jgi:hypothetical protein